MTHTPTPDPATPGPGQPPPGWFPVPGRAWCPCDANPTTTQTTQENP